VYGTLRTDHESPWSRYLHQFVERVGPAKISGKLYHVTATRDFHYPALRPLADGEAERWVVGDILRFKKGALALQSTGPGKGPLLDVLDAYETSEYERGFVTAQLVGGADAGQVFNCFTYWWVASVEGLPLIESGDFLNM
jgi:gamma-glutamylcyclotransferase (GGCT)/AIG2-like uncharacterized protein YtfP